MWTGRQADVRESRRQPLVAFLPYGPAGASGRVRVHQWLEHTGLRAEIHEYASLPNNRPSQVVRHLPSVLAAEARTRRLARRQYQRVLIQREASPFTSGGLIEQVARRSELSVYDFDDALMWTPRSRLDALWSKADACQRAVRVVDRVIAGSEFLADWAWQHNSDVRLIPTCVEPAEYTVKSDFAIVGPPRLVWLGSPSTECYVSGIAEALLEVSRLTGARLTVISSGGASLGCADPILDRVDWTPGVERHLADYDVALAPLANGTWERGKCAYKVLQYAAAGLPTVVSPVGANALAARRLGFAEADTRQEWVDTLVELVRSSQSERQAVGLGARSEVVRHYSYARWAENWLDAVGESAEFGRRD